MKNWICRALIVFTLLFAGKTAAAASGALTIEGGPVDIAWGRSAQVAAKIGDAAVADNVIWESTDEEIATVDDQGVVTGHKMGKATIRVSEKTNSANSAEVAVTVRQVRVSCVGDSLTYGYLSTDLTVNPYPARLQKLLGDDYIVSNFGYSGATLLTGMNRSYKNMNQYSPSLASKPDIVIIMLGTNDSKTEYWDEKDGKNKFAGDAIELVETYQNLPSKPRVVFATSPVVYQVSDTGIRVSTMEEEIVPLQKKLAQEHGWETIDMHGLTENKSFLYLPDGVHFTDIGYYYEAECMYEAVTGEPYLRDGLPILRVEAGTEQADGQSTEAKYAKYACDGDYATVWHSAWDPQVAPREDQWITLELSGRALVDGFAYLPRQEGTNGIITGYEIDVSGDGGKTYTTVADGTWENNASWKQIEFAPIEATHVRLRSVSSVSTTGTDLSSAAEILVYGTPAAADTASKAKEYLRKACDLVTEEYVDESLYSADIWKECHEKLETAKKLLTAGASKEELEAARGELERTAAKLQKSSEDLDPLYAMDAKYYKAQDGTILPYRLYLPDNYDSGKRYPVIVFLHGADYRGTDNKDQLKQEFFKRVLRAKERGKFPAIIVGPQCKEMDSAGAEHKWVNTDWSKGNYSADDVGVSKEMQALDELVESLRQEYHVNQNRLYAVGASMGAFGVWDLVMRHPDLYAGAVAVAGAADPSKAEVVKDVHIWGIHGANDTVVPFSNSTKAMVEAMQAAGSTSVKYTEMQAGHEIVKNLWMQEDFQFLPWLFENCKEMETQALDDAVAGAKKDLSGYTQESADVYREALAQAQALLADDSALQDELDAALAALQEAERGLKDKPKEPAKKPSKEPSAEPSKPKDTSVAAPTVSGVKRQSKKITVAWSTVPGVEGYEVSAATDKVYKVLGDVDAGKTSYLMTGAKKDAVYAFRIRAYRTVDGVRYYSAYSSDSQKTVSVPKAALRSVKKQGKSIRIKWKKISGASGYKIMRREGKKGKFRLVGTVKKGKTTSFIDKKAKAGKKYFYKICAFVKHAEKTCKGAYSAPKAGKR